MLTLVKGLFLGKSGDAFNIVATIVCAVLALLGFYWLAAIAFAGAGVITGVASRVFRWPLEKIVIPSSLAMQIGKTRPTAWAGIIFVGLCLAAAIAIVSDLQAPALRRIGQNLQSLKSQLPEGYADKIDAIAVEGLGTNRANRLNAWLYETDMAVEDARYEQDAAGKRLPSFMLAVSKKVDGWGRALENRVFEGEQRQWFIGVYWFVAAVLIPVLTTAFIITVYQLSARRVMSSPHLIARALVSLTTFALLYFLLMAFYLFPYVSHPYHAPAGISFWIPTALYLMGGAICCGVVQANHRLLFTADAAGQ